MKWLVICTVLLAACTQAIQDAPADDLSVQSSNNDLATYFQEQMHEGDAWQYLDAFPGLAEQDFDGAQATQGVYRMEDGHLLYDHLAPTETNDARYLTERGLETVMDRTSERLGITITSKDDVDELVTRLS